MTFSDFLLMRHELLLAIALIVILIAELNLNESRKNLLFPISIGIFLLVLTIGFLPAHTGNLFGGMYTTSSLKILMKNILNIGVFIIFLQSVSWLKKPENAMAMAPSEAGLRTSIQAQPYIKASGLP